jgi:hypothetical protein
MTQALTRRVDGVDYSLDANPQAYGSGARRIDSGDGAPVIRMADSSAMSRYQATSDLRADAGSIYPYGYLTKVMSKVLERPMSPLTATKHFVLDQSDGWAQKLQLYSMSGSGHAKKVCCANDFPRVAVEGCTFEGGFTTIGSGYKVCWTELRTRDYASRNATGPQIDHEAYLLRMAYRALREEANRLAFFGDTGDRILGLANNPFIPMQISPFKIDNQVADPQAITDVLAQASTLNYVQSEMASRLPNAVIGPPSVMQYLKRTPAQTSNASACCATSIMQQFSQYASHIEYWGQAPELERIGPNGERGLYFYRREADSHEWHYPIALEMLEPYFDGFEYHVNLISRVGSLWNYYPEESLLLIGV